MNQNKSSTSSESVKPIHVWPKGADLGPLREAVIALELPFKVKPFWFEPGKHDRVIALSAGFDLIVDHVYPKTLEARKAAVEWFFDLRELPQAKTVKSKLDSIFGEVTEVWDSPFDDTEEAIIAGKVWP